MLRFIDKISVFECLDAGLHTELGWPADDMQLKTWQDIVLYRELREMRGMCIGEIGGGLSRILPNLTRYNRCYNIDRFEGAQGGPSTAPTIPGVENKVAFLGEFSPEIPDNFFDVVFSVSVIEHITTRDATRFFDDHIRILKPGGLGLHAIDLYIADYPIPTAIDRLKLYRSWITRKDIVPRVPLGRLAPVFTTDMASNPDWKMAIWNKSSPGLKDLRGYTQSVALEMAFRKPG